MRLDLGEIALRLFKIRCVFGMGKEGEQHKFAQKMFGLPKGTYNHWENGLGLIPLPRALMIIRRLKAEGYGKMTLDWIYLGDPDGLAAGLLERLRAAPDKRPESKRGAPGKRKSPLPLDDRTAATLLGDLPSARKRGGLPKSASPRKRKM